MYYTQNLTLFINVWGFLYFIDATKSNDNYCHVHTKVLALCIFIKLFFIDSKKIEILSHCLSLDCKPNSQFINNYCNVFLASICNNKRQGKSISYHFVKAISPTHHQNHLLVNFLRKQMISKTNFLKEHSFVFQRGI